MTLLNALLPAITEKASEIISSKVSDLDINRKVKSFLGSKLKNPLIEKFKRSRELKKLDSEKRVLNKKIEIETNVLNKLNQVEASSRDINKQVKKLEKLKKNLLELDGNINKELETQIDLERDIEFGLDSLEELDLEIDINKEIQSQTSDNLASRDLKIKNKISSIENNEIENKPNVFSFAPKKKERVITKKLGRPKGSKNKKGKNFFNKNTSFLNSDSDVERVPSFLNKDNSDLSNEKKGNILNREKNPKENSVKEVKVSEPSGLGKLSSSFDTLDEEEQVNNEVNRKLLENSEEQLEQLEKANKLLKDISKNKSDGGGLLGGNPVTSVLKFLPLVAAGAFATAGIADVVKSGFNFFSNNKQNEQDFKEGKKTKEEYEADKNKGAGKLAGGTGGVLAGAAAGAAIGSVVPIVGTFLGGLVGAGLGALGGGFLGDQIEKKLDENKKENTIEIPSPVSKKEKSEELEDAENKNKNSSPVYNIQNYNKYDSNGLESIARDQATSKDKKENTIEILSPVSKKESIKESIKENVTYVDSSKIDRQEQLNYNRNKRAMLLNNVDLESNNAKLIENNIASQKVNSQIKDYDTSVEEKKISIQRKAIETSKSSSEKSNSGGGTTIINNTTQGRGGDFFVDDNISSQMRFSVNN